MTTPLDSEEAYEINELAIEPGRRRVLCRGRLVDLTATEYSVLTFLTGQPDKAWTRQEILDGVHQGCFAITERAIDVQIVGIRRKLGDAGRCIETVRGVGYRFRSSAPGGDLQEGGPDAQPE